MAVSVPDIRSRPSDDIYTTVTGVDQDGGGATVRLAVNPLVNLVWAGGAITALGGLVALVRPVRPPPARNPALSRGGVHV